MGKVINRNKDSIKLIRQGLFDKNNQTLTHIDPESETGEVVYSLKEILENYHNENLTITIETTVDASPLEVEE